MRSWFDSWNSCVVCSCTRGWFLPLQLPTSLVVPQTLTQDSPNRPQAGPSTPIPTHVLPFLSAMRIRVTIWLSSVEFRQHHSRPSTQILPVPLCLGESQYAARQEHIPFHRTVVVTATLTLSAMVTPVRRLLRGIRSPWPILRLGTSIPRHGTVAINCRKGVRFVLALATP